MKAGDLIRIAWDRICRARDCCTVNGEPFSANGLKLEWPGDGSFYGKGLPILTITQVVIPEGIRGPMAQVEPAQVVTEGYLVPKDLYDDYARASFRRSQAAVVELVPGLPIGASRSDALRNEVQRLRNFLSAIATQNLTAEAAQQAATDALSCRLLDEGA